MNKYAAERVAFGQPINRYGQIQRHIADSYAEYAAGRAYVYNTARSLDLSKAGSRIDSDGVKLYCSVMGTTVANRAMQVRRRADVWVSAPAGACCVGTRHLLIRMSPAQVLGGNGYMGEYVVER